MKVFASAWLDADTVVFGTKDNKVLSRLLGRRGSTFRFVLQLFVCGPRSPRVTHIPLHETTHAPLADQCGIHRLFAFLTHWPGCISLLDHLVALSLQHQLQRQPQSPGNWRTFLNTLASGRANHLRHSSLCRLLRPLTCCSCHCPVSLRSQCYR